jgi:hypothetical protein
MAHDLFLKQNRRNWSRSQATPPQATAPAIAMAGSVPLKKLALGGMALGTAAGLIFITSPWWRTPKTIRSPMTRRIYLKTGSPSGRITWSRR